MSKEKFNLNDGAIKDLTLGARANKAVAKIAGSKAIIAKEVFEKPYEDVKTISDIVNDQIEGARPEEEKKSIEKISDWLKTSWEDVRDCSSQLAKNAGLKPPKFSVTQEDYDWIKKQKLLDKDAREDLIGDLGSFFDFVKENQTKIPKFDFYTDKKNFNDAMKDVEKHFQGDPKTKEKHFKDIFQVFGGISHIADKKIKQVSDDFGVYKKQLKKAETKAKIGFVKEVEKTGYPIDEQDREKVAEQLAKAVTVSLDLIHDENDNLSQDDIKEIKSPKAMISTAYNMKSKTKEIEGIQKLPQEKVFNPLMEQMVSDMFEVMEKPYEEPEYKKAVRKSRNELKKLAVLKKNMAELSSTARETYIYSKVQKRPKKKPETGKTDEALKANLAKKAMQANRN